MRDHKNTKKMNFGINRNVMTLIGLLLLALGAMGRGIIQTRFLGVGAVNSDQLLEVLNASGGMQAAAAALVFEGLESCAAPIFAVLLIDGFQKNSIPALAPSATPPATWSKEISCRKMPEAWSMAAATMPKPSPDVFAAGPESMESTPSMPHPRPSTSRKGSGNVWLTAVTASSGRRTSVRKPPAPSNQ